MLLMSLAAGLALLLAGLGTYSVLSYTVQRRAREVGVRMALGATNGSIVRLVLEQTAGLIACGLAVGVAASFALRKVVDQQLYEISPGDPGPGSGRGRPRGRRLDRGVDADAARLVG